MKALFLALPLLLMIACPAGAFESRFSMGPNAEWGVTYLEDKTMIGVGRIVLKNGACDGFNKFMAIPVIGQVLLPLRVMLVCEKVTFDADEG